MLTLTVTKDDFETYPNPTEEELADHFDFLDSIDNTVTAYFTPSGPRSTVGELFARYYPDGRPTGVVEAWTFQGATREDRMAVRVAAVHAHDRGIFEHCLIARPTADRVDLHTRAGLVTDTFLSTVPTDQDGNCLPIDDDHPRSRADFPALAASAAQMGLDRNAVILAKAGELVKADSDLSDVDAVLEAAGEVDLG